MKQLLFDVHDVLYDLDQKYMGYSVRDIYRGFTLLAFKEARQKGIPERKRFIDRILEEFSDLVINNKMKDHIADWDRPVEYVYNEKLKVHKSKYTLFQKEFDQERCFYGLLMSRLPYKHMIKKDENVKTVINRLKRMKYGLGLYTDEFYSTLKHKIFPSIGLNIEDFYTNHFKITKDFSIPFLCYETVKNPKSILKAVNAPPENIIVIGNSLDRVLPAIEIGTKGIVLDRTKKKTETIPFKLDSKHRFYISIPSISKLEQIISKL